MSAVLAYDDERRLAPEARAHVEMLRAKGHKVACSRLLRGSWRFKIDRAPWCTALALSNIAKGTGQP
jgi:hypothetical protein